MGVACAPVMAYLHKSAPALVRLFSLHLDSLMALKGGWMVARFKGNHPETAHVPSQSLQALHIFKNL